MNGFSKNPIFTFGAIILLLQIMISWLSLSFVFGAGHAERPIIPFLVLEFASFGFYFVAVEWVRKLPNEFGSNRQTFFWIMLIGLLTRFVFLPSSPIQETDPYRYLWDGQALVKGTNPYQHSPEEAFRNQWPPAEKPESEPAQTFEKINHSGIRTIYPPLAQVLFAAAQFLTPWKLMGWRFMILMAELGIFALLISALRKLRMAQEWSLVYFWSPLVLKEFSNSLHLDVFAILFLWIAVFGVMYRKIILSYGALGLAVLTKFFPIALLPLFFVWTYRQDQKRTMIGLAAFFGIIGLLYLPFIGAAQHLYEGLGRFAGEWQVNDSIFGVIRQFMKFFGLRYFHAELMSRVVSGVLFLVVVFIAARQLYRKKETIDFLKACGVVLACLFFLAPTCNPWYFTWVIPFLAFLPLRSMILFSGLVFFYYLDFYVVYQKSPELFARVKFIEYGVFYLLLGLELWQKNKFPLFCRLQTRAASSATH